jgi:hypothetical protein
MDYNYYGPPQQPYSHLLGVSPPSFAHTAGLDRDATRSIVSLFGCFFPLQGGVTAAVDSGLMRTRPWPP